eukprot:5410469-Amphidinium_carterae.1
MGATTSGSRASRDVATKPFLKKDGIGTLLGDLKAHYTPQVARPHRVTGEVPTRIVRCFGSVPASKLLQ